MSNITRLLALSALVATAFTLYTGCAESRHSALERRQDGFDRRHDARAARRELRSDRADARYDRGFEHW